MEPYKISVVVPVYNAEQYLRVCVDSLLAQHYEAMEIVLVDDGSVDRSGQLCDEYAKKDARIRTVHQENAGLIAAWQRGLSESTGDYLAFVDSDDWVDDTMLAEMAAQLSGQNREMIVSDYVIERPDGTRTYIWQELPPGTYDRAAICNDILPKMLGRDPRYVTLSRCMKLISRSLLTENARFCDTDVTLGEDMTIILPCLLDAERIVVMPHKAYYHYRFVETSMVHQYDPKLPRQVALLMETLQHMLS